MGCYPKGHVSPEIICKMYAIHIDSRNLQRKLWPHQKFKTITPKDICKALLNYL